MAVVDPQSPELPAWALLPPEALPCVDHLVTEAGESADTIFAERQMRLLTEPLYATPWTDNRPFLALAKVGMFFGVRTPGLIPDVLLSLDVEPLQDLLDKNHRSYFCWEYGKAPELVIEVVSNTKGDELGSKLKKYAQLGIVYYVIWDPAEFLKRGRLQILVLRDKKYVPLEGNWLPAVGLGLAIWHGLFEGFEDDWLRWCDQSGKVLPTGAERAERLAEKLRDMGVDPDTV